jgi:cytidylate kinase
MADFIITIDGPAASGKSTVARLLAEKLGASFLDTGAMYRTVMLAAMQAGVDISDETQLMDSLEGHRFRFKAEKDKMAAYINGENVTEQIRSPEVTANVWYVASSGKLREKLVEMQRQFARGEKRIVTEGRDQGTVAFPEANVKFFLTADPSERARRRQVELKATGCIESLEQTQKAIEERDISDKSRTIGPLKPADDAIIIDTTDLNLEEVVQKVICYVEEQCSKKH